jgi:ubiquinol-cytochrome c reductase cytochrome c1 subunit
LKQLFSKLIILSCFSWCNVLAGANDLAIRIEKFNINGSFDEEVLTRGGKFFASRCMSCHSLKFFTHNEIGKKTKVVPENMPQLDPASWGGHPPPDLSLVAKYRGVDWCILIY